MTVHELEKYFNEFLKPENFVNDPSMNGLQIQNAEPDKKEIKNDMLGRWSELKKLAAHPKYGKYATYGNHDIEEKIFLGFTFKHSNKKDKCADERMIKFIEDSNMKILYDDYVMIDDIYLYGRPDYEKPNLHNETRLSEEELISKMDNSKPIIVIDHEPRGTEELSKLGVDVLLNGHTHDGQIWPGTITINWIWDNAYGYKQYGNLHNIVTSGVGLFGVNMRTDSIAEVCDIKVKFK